MQFTCTRERPPYTCWREVVCTISFGNSCCRSRATCCKGEAINNLVVLEVHVGNCSVPTVAEGIEAVEREFTCGHATNPRFTGYAAVNVSCSISDVPRYFTVPASATGVYVSRSFACFARVTQVYRRAIARCSTH